VDSGCRHGPRWLVRRLGSHLAEALSGDETAGLDEALAGAIEAVRRRHAGTCDLTNPDSPSSTVAIVRARAGFLDYLVLCDSAVVFEDAGGVVAITDDRTATLPAYDRRSVARLRNRPGGFWVASTVPESAAEAVTGAVPADTVRRLLLCTDGVSRLVDFFGRDWLDVFRLVEERGPRAAIDAVRTCELRHPDRLAQTGRRVKRHDDATLVVRLS
jgi:Protein phosphatase 2C